MKRKLTIAGFSSRPLFWISCFAYLLSLATPAFWNSPNYMFGFTVLYVGWMGLYVYMYAWLANILILLGFLVSFSKAYWFGLIYSSAAFLISLQSFTFDWYSGEFQTETQNAHLYLSLKQLSIGFYVWELSFIFLFLYCLLELLKLKKKI